MTEKIKNVDTPEINSVLTKHVFEEVLKRPDWKIYDVAGQDKKS